MATFQVGATYTTRSVCDYNCIISITVASRTAKFVTTTEGKRLGVAVYDGNEQVAPWGKYSMSPRITAK